VAVAVETAVAKAVEDEEEVPCPVCWAELLAEARAVEILTSNAADCIIHTILATCDGPEMSGTVWRGALDPM
jgi:hypothetical protein